jgi:hypothetical protein
LIIFSGSAGTGEETAREKKIYGSEKGSFTLFKFIFNHAVT